MAKITTVQQMRALEAAADAAGVSYAAMMEQAGAAVAQAVRARVAGLEGLHIVILVGPGNNGGDGLVAGRLLAAGGANVEFYFLRPPADSDPNVEKARAAGLSMADAENDQRWRVLTNMLRGADVLLDSLFGTGVRLPLRDPAATLLRRVDAALQKAARRPLLVAVDVPSGYDSDSGEADANTLAADFTVTFGAAKVGQFILPAAALLGELLLADIGWPADLSGLNDIPLELADAEAVAVLLPPRPRDAHKGTFGTALIVAGSVNFPGAVFLAAKAAYRSGAGLVTGAIPTGSHTALAAQLPEATWLLLPDEGGFIGGAGAASVVRAALSRADSLLLGPGWGTEKSTAKFLRDLLPAESAPSAPEDARQGLPPTVVDADGLKLLAQIEDWPQRLRAESVLTPHPGEMAILARMEKDAIQADRVAVAQQRAAEWGHVVVLKGAFTVIAAPDGRTTLQPFATPALARAGTGDVLAGLIAGLLAQGMTPYGAAVAGAFIHGMAGEAAADKLGSTAAVLAGDVLDAVPVALSRLGAG